MESTELQGEACDCLEVQVAVAELEGVQVEGGPWEKPGVSEFRRGGSGGLFRGLPFPPFKDPGVGDVRHTVQREKGLAAVIDGQNLQALQPADSADVHVLDNGPVQRREELGSHGTLLDAQYLEPIQGSASHERDEGLYVVRGYL